MKFNACPLLAAGLVGVLFAFAGSGALAQYPFTTIPLGIPRTDAAALSPTGRLYVADTYNRSVKVVDALGLTMMGQGATDGIPHHLILDESRRRLYVLLNRSEERPGGIAVFDTADFRVLPPTIPLPGNYHEGMEYNALTKRLYVASSSGPGSEHVAVVDTDSRQVVAIVPTRPNQRSLCINAVTNRVYVANYWSNDVTVIDGATNAEVVGSPVPVGSKPRACVIDPIHNRIITTNEDSTSISVIDGATNAVAAIPSGSSPYISIVDTSLNLLAVGNWTSNTVSMFRLDTLESIAEIDTQWSPVSLAIDPTAMAMYVGTANGLTWSVELRTFTKQGSLWGTTGKVGLIPYRDRCFVAYGDVNVFKCRDFRRGWDADDDGLSDIAWHNASTGENALWLMNGITAKDSTITLGSSDWVPVLRADLDGDGHSDFVFRNSSTHETAAWFMDGLAARPGDAAIILGPSHYEPLFAVRCAGDAARCIVWRDPLSGAVAYWYMANGPEPAYAEVIYSGGPDWTPVLTGDFDGDSYTDLLWRHTDGRVAIWLMAGDAATGFYYSSYYVILGPGTGWVPTMATDLDGDGRSDILWRNATTGDTAVWLMDGTGAKPNGVLTIMYGQSGWTATHALQLIAGLSASLIWRHVDGTTALWLDFRGTRESYLLSTDPLWRVTHTLHADMNVSEDLLWRNDVTGQTALWIMDGQFVGDSSLLSNDPNWRVVPRN